MKKTTSNEPNDPTLGEAVFSFFSSLFAMAETPELEKTPLKKAPSLDVLTGDDPSKISVLSSQIESVKIDFYLGAHSHLHLTVDYPDGDILSACLENADGSSNELTKPQCARLQENIHDTIQDALSSMRHTQ